jgi:TetR/AcrR family transcriptional regulator, cholesterol catabolism regulator
MFADASVQSEIHHVGMLLTSMLTRAMHPDKPDLTDEDVAIARVIGDVWLSALVGWVTGRTSTEDVTRQMDVAVRLLLS